MSGCTEIIIAFLREIWRATRRSLPVRKRDSRDSLTGRTGVGTAHEGKKRLARGKFPRLAVVRQGDIHAFARVWIRLPRRPETYVFHRQHEHSSFDYLPRRSIFLRIEL